MNDFDESKHPRDEKGRFAEKNIRRQLLINILEKRKKNNLQFFARSGAKSNKNTVIYEIPESLPPKENIMFQSGDHEKTKHHEEHVKKLGYKDFKEYRKGARDFWLTGVGIVYFAKKENKFYKYNEKTHLISAMRTDGTICTFYKLEGKASILNYIRDKEMVIWKK